MVFLLGPPHDDTEAIIGYTFPFRFLFPYFFSQARCWWTYRASSLLFHHFGETIVSLRFTASSSLARHWYPFLPPQSSATNPRLVPNDTTQGHRCAHFSSSDLAAGEIYTLFHRLLQIALLLKILVETFRDLTWKFKVNKIFFWCIEIKFLNSKEWLCER